MESHLSREELRALNHHLSNLEGQQPQITVDKEVVGNALSKMYLCLANEMPDNMEVRNSNCRAELAKMGKNVDDKLFYILDYRNHVRDLYNIYKKHRLFSLNISELNGYEAQELLSYILPNMKQH